MNRRELISGAAAVGALTGIQQAFGSQQEVPNNKSGTLKDLMAKCGGLVGTQAGRAVLDQATPLTAFIRDNLSILVPGNDMWWSSLRPTQDKFYFSDADWVVEFCRANGIAIHGVNLCWNSYNPHWLESSLTSQNGEQILREHIQKVAGRYQGKIDSWSVVNEPIATWFERPDGLRGGPWLSALGPDYIEIAFRAAAEADPKAIRVLNLSHVEQLEAGVEVTRQKSLELLERLLSRGVPVQAVGLQSHLDTSRTNDGAALIRFIKHIMQMGVEVMITEMDVLDNSVPADFGLRDAAVAEVYGDYLTLVMASASPKRLIFWSLSDKGNWYDNLAKTSPKIRRPDNLLHRPGLLDSDMHPKQALDAVESSLRMSCP